MLTTHKILNMACLVSSGLIVGLESALEDMNKSMGEVVVAKVECIFACCVAILYIQLLNSRGGLLKEKSIQFWVVFVLSAVLAFFKFYLNAISFYILTKGQKDAAMIRIMRRIASRRCHHLLECIFSEKGQMMLSMGLLFLLFLFNGFCTITSLIDLSNAYNRTFKDTIRRETVVEDQPPGYDVVEMGMLPRYSELFPESTATTENEECIQT